MDKQNLTMLTDFYELTMANGYFLEGMGDKTVYFDLFYRRNPENGGYVIAAGLEPLIDYLKNIKFTEDDLTFLKKKGMDDRFLDYLRNFKFACDVWAVPEGTPVFPYEPIVVVRGPAIQAQFIETMALLLISHQSLIATKSNRIVRAAEGRAIMEFGSRRAHGSDAAILGARSAFIGGCAGTACAICEPEYGIPALGTMAHSWVQLFDTELEAFRAYARHYPDNCTLLVDTYDVLKSGVPNAIKVFDEFKPNKKGIRIDSGDIAYLTKKARKMLDDAGHPDAKIVISNSLDEYIIRDAPDRGGHGRPATCCARAPSSTVSVSANGSSPPRRSPCWAASTSWLRWRRKTAPLSRRSRSPRTWRRSPTPVTRRSTACSTETASHSRTSLRWRTNRLPRRAATPW